MQNRRGRSLAKIVTTTIVMGASLVVSSPATASPSCQLVGNTLIVSLSTTGTSSIRVNGSSVIEVRAPSNTLLSCSGATPTVTNVDEIDVDGTSAGSMSTLIIDRIDLFTPGATVESPGDQPSEIEFTVDLGDSGDYVWVSSSGAASMALGTDGLNYNAGAESPGDVDVELAGVESFLLFGTAADDSLHADGSGNTGAPATMMVQMVGDDGKDVFVGGSGPDYFAGESGNDVFEGGPGNDRMRFYATSGVQVDLDAGTATGEGSDVMSEVEEVVGTPGNDVIRGTAGADTLYGQEGDDVLEGRGGSDWLDGGDGADRASYASAPSYVWVDLAVPGPQDTHGAGSDVLESIEGLVGSAFSDILSGTSGPDHLEGGPFRDTLVPRAGDDTVHGGSGKDLLLYEGAEAVTVNLVAGRATGQGDDRLSSIESVQGTDGDDTFIASAGSNIFEGGAGFDTLSYARAGGGVTVDLAVAGAQATGGSGSDALAGVEKLIGSRFGDRLRGDDAANVLAGGRGRDRLSGRGGADLLDGGRGSDVCRGGAGADRFRSCERKKQ